MDGLAWFFLLLGLGILLAVCIAAVLVTYVVQRRKRHKVDITQVTVAHSCTDTSSRYSSKSTDEIEQKAKGTGGGQIHVFTGMPDHLKIFEAPPPPSPTKLTDTITTTRLEEEKASERPRAEPIMLLVDDEHNYNPDLPHGIELGKFRTPEPRSEPQSPTAQPRSPMPVSPPTPRGPAAVSIVSVSVEEPRRRQHINASTNQPFRLHLPDAINNCAPKTDKGPLLTLAPVSVQAFPKRLQQLTEDNNEQLYREFESLQVCKNGLAAAATQPANARRNRFYDVVPFESNRVILATPGAHGDYINASYITDLEGEMAYIAAQGPIGEDECVGGRRTATVGDFWRMVWQEEVDCIVMLTQLVEGMKHKCSAYWPDNAGESLSLDGDLQVDLYCLVEDETSFQREFLLTNANFPESAPRKVLQWHFKQWNDCSAPEDQTALLHFIRQVRASPHSRPVLTHCSAGSGRTGVYVALDLLLDHLETDRPLDVYGTVNSLRTQRTNMVQNAEQYATVYEVLALAVRQKLGQEDRDDLTSLDRNKWLSQESCESASESL